MKFVGVVKLYKKAISLILIIFVSSMLFGKGQEDRIQTVMIDGIKHIQNPLKPLKGTIILDVEKKLEIDPYEQEDVGLRYYFSVKEKNGDIIMYSNQSDAHRFSGTGEYRGNMIRRGEGPGEFVPQRGMKVHLINDQIWVTGGGKLAKFDKQGNFLEQILISITFNSFIDNTSYITRDFSYRSKGTFLTYMIKTFKD